MSRSSHQNNMPPPRTSIPSTRCGRDVHKARIAGRGRRLIASKPIRMAARARDTRVPTGIAGIPWMAEGLPCCGFENSASRRTCFSCNAVPGSGAVDSSPLSPKTDALMRRMEVQRRRAHSARVRQLAEKFPKAAPAAINEALECTGNDVSKAIEFLLLQELLAANPELREKMERRQQEDGADANEECANDETDSDDDSSNGDEAEVHRRRQPPPLPPAPSGFFSGLTSLGPPGASKAGSPIAPWRCGGVLWRAGPRWALAGASPPEWNQGRGARGEAGRGARGKGRAEGWYGRATRGRAWILLLWVHVHSQPPSLYVAPSAIRSVGQSGQGSPLRDVYGARGPGWPALGSGGQGGSQWNSQVTQRGAPSGVPYSELMEGGCVEYCPP